MMTTNKHAGRLRTRSFIGSAPQASSNTAKPLRENNSERQEPGRATAPKGPHSPIASVASDLAFALASSGSASLASVFGREFTTTNTPNTMDTTTQHARTETAGTPRPRDGPMVPQWYLGADLAGCLSVQNTPLTTTAYAHMLSICPYASLEGGVC